LPHFYENLLIQETHDCDKWVKAHPKAYYIKPDFYNTILLFGSVIKFRNFENGQLFGWPNSNTILQRILNPIRLSL
jgi:hypothetical protein